jgi:hypothetical protein
VEPGRWLVSDPLASHWVHTVTVARYLGAGGYGSTYADPEDVTGFYDDSAVWNAGEIVGAGRFAFPRSVAYIPPQSEITLPANVFGTRPDGSPRTYQVVTSAVGDGGGMPTPDHQLVTVK